ncbi:uncharacterized protein B0T23DRAFT_193116 [Neurospora hispaniola]|uniref:Uncharacterized protein n=1 Tax=Neurospora hispaniola TaxID=588809 RepID=A0AAJ0I3W7_9PEZI|nr:hypothetical protein B0T23DRAFT_193116 [Neurospora hispaniola]
MLHACGWRFWEAKRNTMKLRVHPDAMVPNNNPLPTHLYGRNCQLVHNQIRPRGHNFQNSFSLPHISRDSLFGLPFEVLIGFLGQFALVCAGCIHLQFGIVDISHMFMTNRPLHAICSCLSALGGRQLLMTLCWECVKATGLRTSKCGNIFAVGTS